MLTALGFPACLTGRHVEISVTMGQIFLPGWCPCKLMPPSSLSSSSMQHQTEKGYTGRGGWWVAGSRYSFPKTEWVPLGTVTEACSWLCIEDHQEPGPSSGRNSCLEMPSWGKGSGQGDRCGHKDHVQVGKAQTVWNGKEGSAIKSNREKRGLKRSWNQLGSVYQLDLEVLAGFLLGRSFF